MQENPFSDNVLTFKICVNRCLLSPVPNLVINGHSPRQHGAEMGAWMLQLHSHGVLVDLTWQKTKINLVEHKNDYFSSWRFLNEKKNLLQNFSLQCVLLLHIVSLLFLNICCISAAVKASIFNVGGCAGVEATAESGGSQISLIL